MSGPVPVLHVFPISHYCEKAAWGLDALGVAHEARAVAPGLHVALAKRLRLRKSQVPILVVPGGRAVQGSGPILDWAEAETGRSLGGADPEAERRLDRVLGVHVRRHFYCHALFESPAEIRGIFSDGLPAHTRALLRLAWPALRRLMIRGMDLAPQNAADSAARIEGELDWLDARLSDRGPYLAGDAPGRIDIAAASLLAPIAAPPEHPLYPRLPVPQPIAADHARWRERPCLRLARRLYAEHRYTPSPAR